MTEFNIVTAFQTKIDLIEFAFYVKLANIVRALIVSEPNRQNFDELKAILHKHFKNSISNSQIHSTLNATYKVTYPLIKTK